MDNSNLNDMPVKRQGKQSLIPLDRDHGQRLVKGINQLLERGNGSITVGDEDGEKVTFQFGEASGGKQQSAGGTEQNRR